MQGEAEEPLESLRGVQGFTNYVVSDHGRVINTTTLKDCSMSTATGGDVRVNLMGPHQMHTRSVKKIVAQAWVPKPDEVTFDTAMILNGDRWDLRSENIVWRPRWYVMKWAQQWDLRQEVLREYTGRRVWNATRGFVYDSIVEAGIADGVLWEHILNAIEEADPVILMHYDYQWFE